MKSMEKENEKENGMKRMLQPLQSYQKNGHVCGTFDSQYTKREKHDSAYKEIAEMLEQEVGEIKTKINNLHAQLG